MTAETRLRARRRIGEPAAALETRERLLPVDGTQGKRDTPTAARPACLSHIPNWLQAMPSVLLRLTPDQVVTEVTLDEVKDTGMQRSGISP